MKKLLAILMYFQILILGASCARETKEETWVIASQEEWQANVSEISELEISEGKLIPSSDEAFFRSSIKAFPNKRSATSITLSQSPEWLNWEPVPNIGPTNLADAPVALRLGDGNYWMFGRYKQSKSQQDGSFQGENATLAGFDIPLKTTPFKNQFDAPGGLKPGKGGITHGKAGIW